MSHPKQAEYLLEMDYTSYGASCREPHVTDDNQLVLCRRQSGHDEHHATRQGVGAIIWEQAPEGTEA